MTNQKRAGMMVFNMTENELRRAVIRARHRSFIDDGYQQVFVVDNADMFVSKLRHRMNGKTIILKAYPRQNKYSQICNGKTIINRANIL